jgi:iron(III) transport system ATP-binding protein
MASSLPCSALLDVASPPCCRVLQGWNSQHPALLPLVVRCFIDSKSKVNVPPEGRNLGMVFQSYALWPHLTLKRNLAMPLAIRKIPAAEQRTLINNALDKVGMLQLIDRYPHQLSGGQQQRVALARALVYSPRVLLLDEPLSNLDAKLREQARVWLKRLQAELGITTVYVTHDQEEALAMSDRIAVMSTGKLLQVGSPREIYERPATAEVAAFVGKSNFIDGVIASAGDGKLSISVEGSDQRFEVPGDEFSQGDLVTLAFRPERAAIFTLDSRLPDNAVLLRGEVIAASYIGSRIEYSIRFGQRPILVDDPRAEFSGLVTVAVPMAGVRLFPRAGVISDDLAALMTAD